MASPHLKRVLGLRDLVLFNVVVVFSVRGMTTAAKMGPVSLLFWLLAVAAFFVPLGLTVAELATRDPGEGGFYRWTRDALGEPVAFLGGWFYWVANLTYFPGLLIFLTGALAFVLGRPAVGDDPVFVLAVSLSILWLVTWLNVRGLEAGTKLNNGAAIASWIAAVLLIVFGAVAFVRFGSATPLSGAVLGADVGGVQAIGYFGTLSFALAGLELAPLMGGEIRDPVRTVPRAILIAGLVIAVLYVAGTLAIMFALPPDQVSPVTGALGAAQAIANRVGLHVMGPIVAALVLLSVAGGLSAWLGSVARLPLAVGLDRYLPAWLARVHPRYGSPHLAIILQAALASVLIVLSQAGSSVRAAYLVLLDMTIVLNFVPFLFIFLALPPLRPDRVEPGVIRVPGGKRVLWVVALAGFGTTALSIVSALIPPPDAGSVALFLMKEVGGLALFGVVGYVLFAAYRRSRGRSRAAAAESEGLD
jgi:glutamate:GABA antiporter